jgi:hypothetical protein
MKTFPARRERPACSQVDSFRFVNKWLAAAFLGTGLLLQSANAALYLLEPFDYPAPEPLTNAIPWSTNGTALETVPTMLIVPGDFSYPPLFQPDTTNSARLQWSSNVKGERTIPGGPLGDPVNGATVYCSFMFYKATTNANNATTNTSANLPIVGLCVDNTTTLNSATCNGIVLNETSYAPDGSYALGIKLGGGVSAAVYPPGGQLYAAGNTNAGTFGQTNLVVMKYTFVPGAGNDTVALWVNPDPSSFGGSEPAPTLNDVAATNASGFNADAATGLGFFQIRGGSGTSAGVLQIDNVRIGTTWADVAPTCITAGISNSPASQSVSPGQSATFSVLATGANPTFQWQTNSGATWNDIPGATNTSYSTPPTVLANNGEQFRCVVSVVCDNSSVTSAVATLTVENCVTAGTSNPTNQTVNAGSSASFTVVGTGTHATYQWQQNSGTGFANIPGATNASYPTPPEPIANNGYQFQCVVSVACDGSSVTSAPALLTVVCNTAQVSTLQNQTVVAGQRATFSVTSSSSNPTFQWATNNGSGFIDIPGATNSSYTTSPEVVGDYGLQFQCTVNVACDGSSISTAATLLVNCFTAGINTDISNTSVSLGAGQTVTFSITANGSLPIYQWQTNNGGGWVNIGGATNANYNTGPLPLADNGLQFRCVVTTPCDGASVDSSTATVSVYSDNAEFLSVASGNIGAPTTWEQSFDGGVTFNNPAIYPPADINTTNTVVVSGDTVANAANTQMAHLTVQSGGQISVNSSTTLTISAGTGTQLDISGILDVTGTLSATSNGPVVVEAGGELETEQSANYTLTTNALIFKSGATYQHNYTTSAGTIPTAVWNAGSTCEITGYTSATTTLAGIGQSFYNLVWNCASQAGALPWGGTVPTVNGDFTMISTGTGQVRISNNNSPTMNVIGNLNLQGGSLDLASGSGKVQVNVSGNVAFSGGSLSNSLTSAGGSINFVKAGTQSFSNATASSIIGPINWVVKNNSTLQCLGVLSSNLVLAAGGKIQLTTAGTPFQVMGNLTNNDNIVIVDVGGATLGPGTYPLMTYGGKFIGAFHSTPTIVNGSVTGGVAIISTLISNQVNLAVEPPSQPGIAGVSLAGTLLTLSATNGIPGDSYAVLASTNAALPLSQWQPITRNGLLDATGALNTSIQLSNTLGANAPQQFFRIQMPSP